MGARALTTRRTANQVAAEADTMMIEPAAGIYMGTTGFQHFVLKNCQIMQNDFQQVLFGRGAQACMKAKAACGGARPQLIADSGATIHIEQREEFIIWKTIPGRVLVRGVGGSASATHMGTSRTGLAPAYYIPGFHLGIVSVRRLTQDYGGFIAFSKDMVAWAHPAWAWTLVPMESRPRMRGGQYTINRDRLTKMIGETRGISRSTSCGLAVNNFSGMRFQGSTSERISLAMPSRIKIGGQGPPAKRMPLRKEMRVRALHEILGHMSRANMKALVKTGALKGTKVATRDIDEFSCPRCDRPVRQTHVTRRTLADAKAHMQTFEAGKRISMDFKGPLPASWPDGMRYWLFAGDYRSKQWDVAILKDKRDVPRVVVDLVQGMAHKFARGAARMSRVATRITGYIDVDQDSVFTSAACTAALRAVGYRVRTIPKDQHSRNPAEGGIAAITIKANSLLSAARLHPNFWPYAVKHAVRIHNLTPNRMLPGNASPDQFCGIKLPRGLHVFGAPAGILKGKTDRMHPHGELVTPAISLGCDDVGAQIALDLQLGKVVKVHNLVALDWTAHLDNDRVAKALSGVDMMDITSGALAGVSSADQGEALRQGEAKSARSVPMNKLDSSTETKTKLGDVDNIGGWTQKIDIPVPTRMTAAPKGKAPEGYTFDKTKGRYVHKITGAPHSATTFEEKVTRTRIHDIEHERLDEQNQCEEKRQSLRHAKSQSRYSLKSESAEKGKSKRITKRCMETFAAAGDYVDCGTLTDRSLRKYADDLRTGRIKETNIWTFDARNNHDQDQGQEFVYALTKSSASNNLYHAKGKKAVDMPLPVGNQALRGPDRIIWDHATRTHVQTYRTYRCFDFSESAVAEARAEGAIVVPMIMVHTWKTNKDGYITGAKVRGCAAGDIERRIMQARGIPEIAHASSSVAPGLAQNMLVAIAAHCGLPVAECDGTAAYMQAREETPKLIKFNPEMIKLMREEGFQIPKGQMIARVRRNLFGYPTGSAKWAELLRAVLGRIGFEAHPLDTCVWRLNDIGNLGKPSKNLINNNRFVAISKTKHLQPDYENPRYTLNAIILTHSDDLRIMARKEHIERIIFELRRFLDLGDPRMLERSLGVDYKRRQFGYDLSMMTKIEELEDLVLKNQAWEDPDVKITRPHDDNVALSNADPVPDEIETFTKVFGFRNALGILMWIALKVRWDILFYVIRLSTLQNRPNTGAFLAVIHLAKFLRDTKRYVLRIDPTEPTINARAHGHPLQVYVDTGNGGCPMTGRTFACILITLHGMPIFFQVKRLATVSTVTTELELMAMTKAAHEAIYANRMLIFMDPGQLKIDKRQRGGAWNGPVPVHEDNRGAVLNGRPDHPISKRLQHMPHRHFVVKQFVAEGEVEIVKIKGSENPADIGTKPTSLHGTNYKNVIRDRLGIIHD